MPLSKKIELFDKHNFVKTTLDKNFEIFIIYMTALEIKALIYLSQTIQIAVL